MFVMKSLLALGIAVVLTACGGGGGGDTVVTTPTTSNAAFSLKSAYAAMENGTYSRNFNMVVKSLTSTATASGTATFGALVDTNYKNSPARSQTQTITGTLVENNTASPIAQSKTTYYDLNGVTIGASGGEYLTVTSSTELPSSVKLNDTGVRRVGNRYVSFENRTLLGTIAETWVVEADTSTSVLFKVLKIKKDSYEKIVDTNIEVYKITNGNNMKIIYENGLTDEFSARIDYY